MHPKSRPCREKLAVVGAHSSCTPRDCVQSGTRAWRVKRSHGTHVRGALRSKFSWHAHRSPGKVEASRCPCASVRRQCQRLCSIESWSRSRQRQSKARSAVLAASAQGQGSTEVPNVKRAAAHCHLVVVGGHVDSSGASGCRQRPKCEKQRFWRLVLYNQFEYVCFIQPI